jgi:hypothetical protein
LALAICVLIRPTIAITIAPPTPPQPTLDRFAFYFSTQMLVFCLGDIQQND